MAAAAMSNDTRSLIAVAPHYLDDEGGGERCYLLHHLAASKGEAQKLIERMGHEWQWLLSDAAVVWMRPNTTMLHAEDWWDEVPEGTEGAVRYWRFTW
jgi:hypothetical protein